MRSIFRRSRIRRLLQFVVYISLAIGGFDVVVIPPEKFQDILGFGLVLAFGLFVLVGAVLGSIAVLPGIWWLERAAIIALSIGLFSFMVLVIALGASAISFFFGVVLTLMFVIRYLDIKPADLAPKTVAPTHA